MWKYVNKIFSLQTFNTTQEFCLYFHVHVHHKSIGSCYLALSLYTYNVYVSSVNWTELEDMFLL